MRRGAEDHAQNTRYAHGAGFACIEDRAGIEKIVAVSGVQMLIQGIGGAFTAFSAGKA
jgi:hypothetical protein